MFHFKRDSNGPQALDGEALAAVRRIISTVAGGYRLDILLQLLSGPQDVSGLAQQMGVSMSTVSQNLRELRNLGLVEFRRCGRKCVYRLPLRYKLEYSPDEAELRVAISANHHLTINISVQPDKMPDGLVKVVPRSRKPRVP